MGVCLCSDNYGRPFEACRKNHAKRAVHAARRLTLGPVHQPLSEDIPQYLEVVRCGMTTPEWYARCLDLASMTKRGLESRKLPVLDQRTIVECWLVFTIVGNALLRKPNGSVDVLFDSLLSNSTKMVLLEVTISAKEDSLGVSLFGFLVFNCGQLEFAYVIGNLLKPEIFGTAIPINNDLSTQCMFECHMQCGPHGFLPIVVVKLNGVVCLEHAKPFRKKNDKVLPHFAEHCGVGAELISLVRECEVLDGAFKREGAETCQGSHPRLNRHVSVSVVSSHEGIHMQRDIWEVAIPENLLVLSNLLLDGYGLLMKNESDEVMSGVLASVVAGFVNENGKLLHGAASPKTRNAGGIPRPLTAFRKGTQDFYTTGRGVLSRCNHSKHMFASQSITAGKLTGRVIKKNES